MGSLTQKFGVRQSLGAQRRADLTSIDPLPSLIRAEEQSIVGAIETCLYAWGSIPRCTPVIRTPLLGPARRQHPALCQHLVPRLADYDQSRRTDDRSASARVHDVNYLVRCARSGYAVRQPMTDGNHQTARGEALPRPRCWRPADGSSLGGIHLERWDTSIDRHATHVARPLRLLGTDVCTMVSVSFTAAVHV